MAGGSLISIALSIEFAYDEADPANLLWGVLLGVVPLLLLGWAIRSRSTTLLEIATWACTAILFALVVRRRPGGDGLALIEAVYLAGALLLTWPRARRLRATHI